MRSSLGLRGLALSGLERGGDLRIRGREQPGHLLVERGIGRQAGQLALPKVEIAAGQSVEIGGLVVVFQSHAPTIAQPRKIGASTPLRSRKARLVALRHRR
jgi:hypothetical protein